MTRSLLLVALLLVLSTKLNAVDRKDLNPGLVATFSQKSNPSITVSRLEAGVGITLNAAETPDPRLSSVSEILWSGYIQIITPGVYQFSAEQEGSQTSLRVNGAAVELGKETRLNPGVQRFEVQMQLSDATRHRLVLHWQGPGFRKEPIPYFFFGHLPSERPTSFANDSLEEAGRFLFEELACAKCHQGPKNLIERTGPSLTEIGKRVYPGWMDAWLEDPSKLRPHTTMPTMFATDAQGRAERYAVVKYLSSLAGPMAESRAPSFSNEYTRSIASGQRLFISTGCAACHGSKLAGTMKLTEDDDDKKPIPARDRTSGFYGFGTASGEQSIYDLGALGSKTRPEELARYLQDPLKAHPHGRMPNMQLSSDEARDLSRYLCRSTSESIDRMNPKGTALLPDDMARGIVPAAELARFTELQADAKWAELGRRLVSSKGCLNCHALEDSGKSLANHHQPPPTSTFARQADGAMTGCLSENASPAKQPVYKLDSHDRKALVRFLSRDWPSDAGASPQYQARSALKRFACLNCHSRDGEGGIGTELADRMKAQEKGEAADNELLPPRLTGIGHKVRTEWLKSVLTSAARARPWMSLRMPQYGEKNVGGLIDTLPKCDGSRAEDEQQKVQLDSRMLEAGRKLAGKEGLGCIACHDINGFAAGGTRGPDLALTSQRVREEWYTRWMHNPQRLAPGTRMPQNFNDGRSVIPTILDGNADAQIEALWAYFALGPGLPLPAGMEPPKGLVIIPKDRPEVVRTFMPDGAGSKAIAVGYPGGFNLVFDAHAARVSYSWEGNFLDAAPVWNNRGGNPAKLLGPKFFQAPAGHPWAVSNDRNPPDFTKRADDFAWGKAVPNDQIFAGRMNVQFLGYRLNKAGQPIFRYRFGESDSEMIGIEDMPTPNKAAVATGITRSYQIEGTGKDRHIWHLIGQSILPPRIYAADGAVLPTNGADIPAVGTRLVVPDASRAMVWKVSVAPPGSTWHVIKQGNFWLSVLRLPENKQALLTISGWNLPRDNEGLLKALPE